MFGNLSGPQKAAGFYIIAFALTLMVVVLAGTLGEASPVVTMLTPALSVLLMMLVLTDERRSRSGWLSLGVRRAGFNGWWFANILGGLYTATAGTVPLSRPRPWRGLGGLPHGRRSRRGDPDRHRSPQRYAEVHDGLTAGEAVSVHPSDQVNDGVAVVPRA